MFVAIPSGEFLNSLKVERIEHAKRLLKKGQSTLTTSYDVGLSGVGSIVEYTERTTAILWGYCASDWET